jgi:cyclic pyranopterin phosphate synthase
MPPQGVQWKPHNSMLTFEETLRLCKIMAGLGIRKIKVTGGEPLVRRGLASFIKSLKALSGMERVTLTTNGTLLGAYLDEAEAVSPASLPDGINISLDALDTGKYTSVTREANVSPAEILPHIDRLLEMRVPVKINCVPIRGYNDEEIVSLAALGGEKNIAIRFIELMPLGSAKDLKPVSGGETAAIIEEAFGALAPFEGVQGSGPAVYYSLPGFAGKIGFISPLSHGFCETCNRLRLTSEGFLKPCLSSTLGFDLRELLRSGACDGELIRVITEAAAKKPAFHTLSDFYGVAQGQHPDGMSGIGG